VETATQRILDLANNDALTGLSNRRSWEEKLSQMVSLYKREKKPVTLVFMDLDNFKKINDKLGHAAGDRLLVSVAEQLKEQCRDSDLLGRWGGDEFGIALPHADHDQATLFVQRLREKLHNTGISAGVVTLREDESMEDFLSRADKEMYRDKGSRRESVDNSVSISIQ
jgi:diguanylate cyclase (GGDEF)-like protein